jgi:O-antigen/teichoic acid export membrane protein
MLRTRHVLSTTAATILSGVLSLGLTVLVARLLDPEQNGNYAQFVLILNLANIALNFGLGPASTYFIASSRASVEQVTALNIRALAWIAAGVVATCWALVQTHLAGDFSADFKIPLPLLLIGVGAGILMLVGNQAAAILMGLHRYDSVNALNVFRSALLIATVALAAALGARSPLQMSVAHSAALGVAAVASFLWLARVRPRGQAPASTGSRQVLGAMVSYGGLLYLSNLLHYSAMRGLLLIVSLYCSTAAVGFLTTALLLLEVTLLVPSAIGQLLFPQSSGSGFDSVRLQALLRINAYAGVAVIAVVAVSARPIIVALMGARYAPVATALIHLTPSIILLAIPRILSQILSGQGQARYPLAAAAISLVIGLPLAIFLLPRVGFLGAAWVTNAVSLVTAIVTLIGYSRTHGVSVGEMLRPRRSDLDAVLRLATARGA